MDCMENKKKCIRALESEKSGDWKRAHRIVQEISTKESAWIHAYLHRVEGDRANAGYWYHRARKPECHTSLKDEWQVIYNGLTT